MTRISKRYQVRRAVAARQIILFLVLVVVGGAGAYEFGIARPGYEKAWERISEIDDSIDSGNFTAAKIEEEIGKQAFAKDDSIQNIEIRTYRWVCGLPFRSHDIHVVYTKVLPKIAEENPELADVRYYYSASGGTPITEANLPAERPSIVFNKNPPQMAAAGGGPPPANDDDEDKDGDEDSDKDGTDEDATDADATDADATDADGESDGDTDAADDGDADMDEDAEEPGNDEPADEDDGDSGDETPADDEPADDEPADDEPADDEPADDEPADDEPADEEPADDGDDGGSDDDGPADETPETPDDDGI